MINATNVSQLGVFGMFACELLWYNLKMSTDRLSITKPDDWHIHLRDGDLLATTVPHAAERLGRAIVMPNLQPPVTNVALAQAYRERIMAMVPKGATFDPKMSLYLTDQTTAQDVQQAASSAEILGFKLYPAGATTNSSNGVTDIKSRYPIFEAMQQHNVPLQIHGEVTSSDIDIFDREKVFIDTILIPLTTAFPRLRVVLEHITTADAVDFVTHANEYVAATITAHHLMLNRNDMLVGGIKPHHYCLPVLKRQRHQKELIKAATSGNPKFFMGSDSAPHAKNNKETSCGCAGIYTGHASLELYTTVFEQNHALDKLENFCSKFGANFYQLTANQAQITLIKQEWQVPATYQFGNEVVVPFLAEQHISWKIVTDEKKI